MTRFIFLLYFFVHGTCLAIPYAKDGVTNKIVRASVAFKDGRRYTCLECEEELILKKGEIKTPHFAHKRDPESTCTGGGVETNEHRYAKELIDTYLGRWEFRVPCEKCPAYQRLNEFSRANGFRSELEYSFGPFRLDVGVLTGETLATAIEVRHTHAVHDDKKLYLSERGIPLVEIKASSVIKAHEKKTYVVKTLHTFLCAACKRKEERRDFRPCLDCETWAHQDHLSITMTPALFRYKSAFVCDSCKDACPTCQTTMSKMQKKALGHCYRCLTNRANNEKLVSYAMQRNDLETLRKMQSTLPPDMCTIDIDGAIKAIEEEKRKEERERNLRTCCECNSKNDIKELFVIKSRHGALFSQHICVACSAPCPSCESIGSKAKIALDGSCAACQTKKREWIERADKAVSKKDLAALKALLTSCALSLDEKISYESRYQELVEEARVERNKMREAQRIEQERLQLAREEAARRNKEQLEAIAKDIVDKNSVTLEMSYHQKTVLSRFHLRWLQGNDYAVDAKHLEACRAWIKLPRELAFCKDELIKRVNTLMREHAAQRSKKAKRNREAAAGCPDISTFFTKEPRTS